LPQANEPFSLDDRRFAVAVVGPGGADGRCYNLDVRPAAPIATTSSTTGSETTDLAQFPVIEKAPGDPGYSDLWDIWKVITPDGFKETNWIREAATVGTLLADPASGFTRHRRGSTSTRRSSRRDDRRQQKPKEAGPRDAVVRVVPGKEGAVPLFRRKPAPRRREGSRRDAQV
jgi:hypothetical protein